MIPMLDAYEKYAGKEAIARIRQKAAPLKGKHVVHVNATSEGGGVAEILNTLIFLMNDVGIRTGWRVLLGSNSFFSFTKGLHNSLQGAEWKLTPEGKATYTDFCRRNAMINHIKDHDIVIIHDPQPLGLIADYEHTTKWFWRCHIDISKPDETTLQYLLPYIKKYDAVIVSKDSFRIPGLRNPQFIIPPAIDPLSEKNKPLTDAETLRLLKRHRLDLRRPMLVQVARFDPWKGHLGVLEIYRRIREEADCQLVLVGGMASDDPQGPLILREVRKLAAHLPDVRIITEKNDLLVNALQRKAAFTFQNSLREGFGLTVAEALWKQTPVIATPVGGIPLQVLDGKTGFLMEDHDAGIRRGLELLKDSQLRARLGRQGKEHVRQHFLVTRHLEDYLNLFNRYFPPPDLRDCDGKVCPP